VLFREPSSFSPDSPPDLNLLAVKTPTAAEIVPRKKRAMIKSLAGSAMRSLKG
jgi:hypothetical protein